MRKTFLAFICALSLVGCQQVTNDLTTLNSNVVKYAALAGKDLLLIGNILVTAECSKVTAAAGSAISNVLNVVAPNSTAANTVANILSVNGTIVNQLCPLAQAIQLSVGAVPSGTPVATVAPSSTAGATHPMLIIKKY